MRQESNLVVDDDDDSGNGGHDDDDDDSGNGGQDDDDDDDDANEWWILHFLTLPNRSLGSHFLSACINKIIILGKGSVAIRLSNVVLL